MNDAISRDLLAALDAAQIAIVSATSEVVGWPPVRVEGALPMPPTRPGGSAA